MFMLFVTGLFSLIGIVSLVKSASKAPMLNIDDDGWVEKTDEEMP